MLNELKDKSFVVLDSETTGLDESAEIVELGIIDSDGRVLLDTFVVPVNDIPAEAEAIHGISTDEAVNDGVIWPDVFNKLCELVNGQRLVIYNKSYDVRLIEQSCNLHGLDFSRFQPESVHCAMVEYGEWYGVRDESHHSRWQSLSNAAKQRGVKVINAHRAIGDCMTTLGVIKSVWYIDEVQFNYKV